MKNRALFLFLFLLLSLASSATAADADALGALQSAHPGSSITAQSQWGDTAAAVLSLGDANILCVAEKQGATWKVIIDNSTALRQGDDIPALLLDTDTVLFWSYADDSYFREYCATKENGIWGDVSLRLRSTQGQSAAEHCFSLRDYRGCRVIMRTSRYEDGNENPLYETASIPVPANWLSDCTRLDAFDAQKFPCYSNAQWVTEALKQGAAAYLMPDDAYCGGNIEEDSMEFLMRKEDGTLIFVGVSFSEPDGWTFTQSTPLPEGTVYGYDNEQTSLYLPQKLVANMKRFSDGTWGLNYIKGDKYSFVCFGQGWIAQDSSAYEECHFGDHSWADVTAMDWSSLPSTMQDALSGLNSAGWAVVNNPNTEDRLHLRTKPDQSATSLGKYFNGTPVRVLVQDGDWVKADVFGVQGWMLRSFLAFGDDMSEVHPACPFLVPSTETVNICGTPNQRDVTAVAYRNDYSASMRVISILDEKWYHVWYPWSGLSGYIWHADLRTGNE